MSNSSKVRVYIACSLDGFIAGPEDDLSWLPGADGSSAASEGRSPSAVTYEGFIKDVGALLMGRRTYDVVVGFEGDWSYGALPVLVTTHRELTPKAPTVRGVSGSIEEVVGAAKEAAGEKDVYLDGGALIRQALDAGLVDELIVTMVPCLLGQGHPLFAGVTKRHQLELLSCDNFGGGMVQLRMRPKI